MPILGVEVLIPIAINADGATEFESLSCEIKGLKATGHLTPNGIIVLAGSQAVLNDRPSFQKYPWPLNMRQKLKDDGVLTVKTDHLLFTKDVEFSSPSAAAAVIHGGHANGLIAWKNKDGKTLKHLQARILDEAKNDRHTVEKPCRHSERSLWRLCDNGGVKNR